MRPEETDRDLLRVPPDLREAKCWMPWQRKARANGKVAKVPLAPSRDGLTLYPRDPLDASGWQTFEAALAWLGRPRRADGVGVVLTPGCGWVALDLDGCREEGGRLAPEAQAALRTFRGVYSERSPGGSGLHLLVRGECPPGWRRRPGLDVIDAGFVTVTAWEAMAEVDTTDRSAELAAWHTRLAPVVAVPPYRPARVPDRNDADLIRRAHQARSGVKFAALWAGELAGYPSASEGDLALTLMLLYWASPDASDDRIDRLFRQSGRYRPRWDQPVHAPYGRRTIQRARAVSVCSVHRP